MDVLPSRVLRLRLREMSPQVNADERRYKFTRITESVIGAFYAVYTELGFGFVELVYREAMRIVLEDAGIHLLAEASLKATFRSRALARRNSYRPVAELSPLQRVARRLAFENEQARTGCPG